jgi:hypothetical protein
MQIMNNRVFFGVRSELRPLSVTGAKAVAVRLGCCSDF